MTLKENSTLSFPVLTEPSTGVAPAVAGSDVQWRETRLVHPLYVAMAAQFSFSPAPLPAGELPEAAPSGDLLNLEAEWLDQIDDKVRAFHIRQISSQILNASEPGLQAFVRRHLRKPDKTTADRDKLDLLLVQYFGLCASEDLCRREISAEDVAQVLKPVLPQADATRLEWCEPLEEIIHKVEHCQSLRDLMEGGLLEQGRLLKDSAGYMFYDPAALVAFCRFNFLLRRAFIRLLHNDLSAVSRAIQELNERGVRSVDCRRAGFSAAEPTTRLREFCDNWRQPFQKDYTESSVNQAFEQLLALRADLEDALLLKAESSGASDSTPVFAQAGENIPTAHVESSSMNASAFEANPVADLFLKGQSKRPPTIPTFAGILEDEGAPSLNINSIFPTHTSSAAPEEAGVLDQTPPDEPSTPGEPSAPAEPSDIVDARYCLDAIQTQLGAAPAARNRSMFTVTLRDTKVLLSSWEVSAFVETASQEAEDMRRAVVARTMISVAMDQRKRSAEVAGLTSSLALGRREVLYFRGQIDLAKCARKIEAAVNLGISTKRLIAVIEAAEKL